MNRFSLTSAAALAAMLTGGVTAQAQVPSKIFFHDAVSPISMAYRMNPDGTAKTALFSVQTYSGGQNPQCSTGLHNGERLFVQKVDLGWWSYQYAPELRFFSESGASYVFALDFATVDPEYLNGAQWVPGDQEISFVGRRVVEGQVTEAGVFAVQVQYQNGTPVGISSPYLKVSTPTHIEEGQVLPSVWGYDWNPAGNALAFSNNLDQLCILDAGGARVIRSNGRTPRWAPGTINKIAYLEGSSLCTIGVNGAGWKNVITVRSTPSSSKWLEMPTWSFDGSSLLYTMGATGGNGGLFLYKILATGSGNKKIGGGRPIAWK